MQDSSNRQIILITTVDIGEGRTAQIKLREGDSPQVREQVHASMYDSIHRHRAEQHRKVTELPLVRASSGQPH